MEKLCQPVDELRNLFGWDRLMIPCRVGEKTPAMNWKNLTLSIMSDPDHLIYLKHYNIAIVNGEKSSGLCSIDLDEESLVDVMLKKNPFLRETTQTKGKRGMNFWVKMRGDYPSTFKLKQGKLSVGEFRSTGSYTIMAGVHPEGMRYQIKKRVKPMEITYGELWLPTSNNTERTDENRRGVVSFSQSKKLLNEEDIFRLAQPHSPSNNHSCLFALARGVKGLEFQNNKTYSVQEKRELFDQWHSQNPFLREGQSKEEYYFEFLASMEGVVHPLGQEDVMELALKRAQTNPCPEEASGFEDKRMQLLLSLCRELQFLSGGKPFFLSCRTAAGLIGHSGYKTVNLWLRGFELSKLLEVVRRGGPNTNKANRYRYLGQLDTQKA